MVKFVNGKPDKKEYRRFKIKSFQGNNDVLAIKEVIERRYHRLKKEKREFPDLIIVDGGKGQLSYAIKGLKNVEVALPIIALAKKKEEIFVPGKKESIQLNRNSEASKFLQSIRNEAHRFAIAYNRNLRKISKNK